MPTPTHDAGPVVYSYARGVFSARIIETASYESVPMRYVAANHPDHDTICTFRQRFLAPLNTLFVQIMGIAHQMVLVEAEKIAIDGSKVNANASKHKAMIPKAFGRACQLEDQLSKEVAKLMDKAEQADTEVIDDQSLPEEIAQRTERLEKIRQAKAMIEEWAAKRYEAEKAAHDQKMADRAEKEKRTGKKMPGCPPAPP